MEWCMTNKIQLPEVVDRDHLNDWRSQNQQREKIDSSDFPAAVRQFIDALAEKLDDFIRIRYELVPISGRDLLLGNVTEIDGETVFPWAYYKTPVPYMVAADHRTSMYRIFRKRGKQGLISFVRGKVKGTDLERCLRILNTVVFNEDSPQFREVMDEIAASKKLESEIV